jgi:hypothetical protein
MLNAAVAIAARNRKPTLEPKRHRKAARCEAARALRMRRPMVPRHGVFPVTWVYSVMHVAGKMGSAA